MLRPCLALFFLLHVFSLFTNRLKKTERMKKVLVSVGLFLSMFSQAQNYVHQAIILNEGYFDYQTNEILVPVTIGSYNPANQVYQVVDTLEGMRFGSDVLIKYLTTYDSYLHVYDATNLSLIAAIDTIQGPKWAAQNIVVEGSSAYIAVNNGYEWGNEKGIIGQMDLNNLTYGNEIDLGPDGKNPDNMFASNGILYTVNNKDWSGASVSRLPIGSTVPTTANISSAITGCGTSALRDDKLVYQISMETTLNEFDLSLMNNVGPLSGHSINYYELAQEPVSGNLYASETDYFSFGKVHLYDANNNELSYFDAGVSPGTIVFDVRSTSANLNELASNITVYPNPATDILNVNVNGSKQIIDLNGKVLVTTNLNKIEVSNLNSGVYILSIDGQKASFIKR